MNRRWRACAVLAGTVVGLAAPSVAHADPAGPTDYRTDIVSVSPTDALDAIAVSIVGGDAFVEVEVQTGHELVVLGYRPDEEPYLRIGPDGGVEQNVRSYATYYNEDRYGNDDIPDVVDTSAPPEWEQIGDGGSWAWHDHRAHWMSEEPMIGLDPGDTLPAQVVPMMLDGERVEIEVETTLLSEPSSWPSVAGLLVGLQLGLVGVWLGRASTVLAAIVLSIAALVAGLAQYLSLPASTGPLLTWWLLPALAMAAAAATIAIYGRSIWIESGLVAAGALLLVVWAWVRRDHLTSAFVPTELSMSWDRAITTAVLIGGAVVVVGAMWQLYRDVVPRPDAGSGPGVDAERGPGTTERED